MTTAAASDNNSITIGFPLYRFDYEYYHKLKREGRIKHGELAKFLRLQFRQFLESHAGNMPTPTNKVKNNNVPVDNADNAPFADNGQNSEAHAESIGDLAKSNMPIGAGQASYVYVKPNQSNPKSLQEEGYPAGHIIEK